MEKKRIVILGAGFAGLRAALDFCNNKTDYQITLVNDTLYHVFHADLYELAAATIKKNTKWEYKQTATITNIPLKQIFRNKKIDIILDKALKIDPENRVVSFEKHEDLVYDYLLLATGSTTSYFGIPGAESFSQPFKTTEDALNIRDSILELLTIKQQPLSVVIAGAGMTGVELAAEIARIDKKNLQVILCQSSKHILPGLPEWVYKKATKKLKRLHVVIKTDHRISQVEKEKIFFEGGEVMDYDYLMWTAGIYGNHIQDQLGSIRPNKKGQFDVKGDLSIESYPNIFVAGDMAGFYISKTDSYIPANAHVAIEEGTLAAENIIARINGDNIAFYEPPPSVFAIPVGSMFALSNIFHLSLQGFSGWVVKRIITLKYLLSILPFTEAFTIWWRGISLGFNESSNKVDAQVMRDYSSSS